MIILRLALGATFLTALAFARGAAPSERLSGAGAATDDPDFLETNYYLEEGDPYAPASAGDADLGEQVILRRQSGRAPVEARADAFLFWSDNVSARSFDELEGWFWGGSLSARWKQYLGSNWFFDAYAYQDAFFYDREGLDFQSTEFGAGLIRNLPGLDNLTLYGRYEFLYLHAENPAFNPAGPFAFTDDRYHRLRVGGFKALVQRPNHILTLAAGAAWDFDASGNARKRTELAVRLAYTRRLTHRLRATACYRLAYRDYLASSRQDWNQYGGLELACSLTPWADLHASLLFGDNQSNHALRDYSAWQAGLGLGLRGRF